MTAATKVHGGSHLAFVRALVRIFALFCTVLMIEASLFVIYGQTQPSSLHGRVLDATRRAIPGAHISAIPEGREAGLSVISDDNGEFSIDLAPGKYTVSIVASGFSEDSRILEIESGSISQDFVLDVAALHETVVVRESPGYQISAISSGTKTLTLLRDIPQSITVVTQQQVRDQLMLNVGDVVRYIPGITAHQGENNRDQIIIRGNSSSADFFVNGLRDDVQYYRDLYNLERVEALKGPNAMIFGRGGGGGVINRVTKEAGFMPLREVTLMGGSYGNKRFTTDFNQSFNNNAAFRLNGMYENSNSFRDHVNLERYGVNPTLTFLASNKTRVTASYEYFNDNRIADRGIPSFQGRPADLAISTYFGNPDDSRVDAHVNMASAMIEHQAGRLNIQNRFFFGDYDRRYQNYVPGAVNVDKTLVALSAYNNATQRRNLFNQTNLVFGVSTGQIRHTLLGGVEVGQQLTDNFRNTGYFNNTAISIFVPYSDPTINTPVTFRQSVTDANNHIKTNLGAAYLQDQVGFSRHIEVVAGLRLDYFDLQYHNNRNDENLRRIDNLVSPRVGIIFKPTTPLSFYGNYSVSYLPSSGDQFSSLTAVTQQVKPEKFNNYELGMKWDINRELALTTAGYRLDRTNTRSTDPNDPTRIVQTGETRSNGYEISLNGIVAGSWRITGGYAYQDAFIVSATTNAVAGAKVAQVPHHMFSLWNNYRIMRRLEVGLGLLRRSDMFAAIDNTVTLPAYTRADAGLFFSLTERMRLQANIENVFNKTYYMNADSNTNISPGAPRSLRIALTTRF